MLPAGGAMQPDRKNEACQIVENPDVHLDAGQMPLDHSTMIGPFA
jgi:hypothetical protein